MKFFCQILPIFFTILALKDDHEWIAAEMLEKFAIENKISRQELFVKLGKELNVIFQLNVTAQRFVVGHIHQVFFKVD